MLRAGAISATKLKVGLKQRLPFAYNQAVDKHVESLCIPYLDESSNLSGSTDKCKGAPRSGAFFVSCQASKA
jgi:hypothetical protein